MSNVETARIYHSGAKVFLDYDVRVLQEILDSLRNEAGAATASLLREYEHKLVEAERLAQNQAVEASENHILSTLNRDIE